MEKITKQELIERVVAWVDEDITDRSVKIEYGKDVVFTESIYAFVWSSKLKTGQSLSLEQSEINLEKKVEENDRKELERLRKKYIML